MRTTIDKACEICSAVYQVEPSILKHGKGKYCSPECAAVARYNRRKKTQLICERCGKTFEIFSYKLKSGRGKYCSKTCFNPPVYANCLNCGKEFRYSPSTNKQYCSAVCRNSSEIRNQNVSKGVKLAWQDGNTRQNIMIGIAKRSTMPEWYNAKHFQKGKDHPRYKGNKRTDATRNQYPYKKWRWDVFKRDNFTCQICFKRGGRLHAHHIKHWAEYPELRFELDNGLTLCVDCHSNLHGWKIGEHK